MENLNSKIETFLTVVQYNHNSDFGFGLGYGYGYGLTSGSVFREGTGIGYGFGSGSGAGFFYNSDEGSGAGIDFHYGSGFGEGLISFNKNNVYYIDNIPTVILRLTGNVARGFIINDDLTTKPCVLVKGENEFAHGENFCEAKKALEDKIFEKKGTDEKIELFLKEFKPNIKYPARAFYEWHNKLTGSCEFGRNIFVKNNGIDLENGTYTIDEFIEITKEEYGGDVIKKIKERINE